MSFICVLLLGGTIFYVKSEADAANGRLVEITAFTAREKDAANLKSRFGDRGYSISVKGEKHVFPVTDGFCLTLEMSNPSMAKSVSASLLQKAEIRKLGLETKGKTLKLKKKFASKAAADKRAKELRKTTYMQFAISENTKDTSKQGFKCVVSGVPAVESSDVSEFMQSGGFVDIDENYADAAPEV